MAQSRRTFGGRRSSRPRAIGAGRLALALVALVVALVLQDGGGSVKAQAPAPTPTAYSCFPSCNVDGRMLAVLAGNGADSGPVGDLVSTFSIVAPPESASVKIGIYDGDNLTPGAGFWDPPGPGPVLRAELFADPDDNGGFVGSTTVNVTGITVSDVTATATTSAPHLFTIGQRVYISGADQPEYTGSFLVTPVPLAPNSFTFTVASAPPLFATQLTTSATTSTSIVARPSQERLSCWTGNGNTTACGDVPDNTLVPMPDSTWFEFPTALTSSSPAKSLTTGNFHLALKVSGVATPSGNTVGNPNLIKVRTSGTLVMKAQSFQFMAPANAGERSIVNEWDQATSKFKNYDGSWDFDFFVKNPSPLAVTEVKVFDGDLDYGSSACDVPAQQDTADTDSPNTPFSEFGSTGQVNSQGTATGRSCADGAGTPNTPNTGVATGNPWEDDLTTPAAGTASAADGTQLVLSSLTYSAGTTLATGTSAAHLLFVGQRITVSGAVESSYNGTFSVVSVPSSTEFTYKPTTAPSADTATGAPQVTTGNLNLRSVGPTLSGQGVVYRITDPIGQQFLNGNPSGNQEWEQFKISTLGGGDYQPASLSPGIYRVHIEGVDAGNLNAWHNFADTLGRDSSGNALAPDAFYTIGGVVWNDLDHEGTNNSPDRGVAGVTLNLLNSSSVVIATATTDSEGEYSFRVPAGEYTVVAPAGGITDSNNGDGLGGSLAYATTGSVSRTNVVVGPSSLTATESFGYSQTANSVSGEDPPIGVAAANTAPTATPNDYATDEDQPISGNVVTDDTDPELDSLTAIIVDRPSNGTLAAGLSTSGAFTYTPNPNFNGTDTFTYKVFDRDPALVIEGLDGPESLEPFLLGDADADQMAAWIGGSRRFRRIFQSITANGAKSGLDFQAAMTGVLSPTITIVRGSDSFSPAGPQLFGGYNPGVWLPRNDTQNQTPLDEMRTAFLFNLSPGSERKLDQRLTTQPCSPGDDCGLTQTWDMDDGPAFGDGWDLFVGCDLDFQCPSLAVGSAAAVGYGAQGTGRYDAGSGRTAVFVSVIPLNTDGDPIGGCVAPNTCGQFDVETVEVYEVLDYPTDGLESNVATVTIHVAAIDDVPVAADDTVTTQEEVTVTETATMETLAANDTPGEGQNTWSLFTQASNGTATVNADGTFSYTPNPNYNGPDSFSYRLCDGDVPADCDTATVNVTVNSVDDVPEAVDDNPPPVTGNQLTGSVATNDTPGDGVNTWSLATDPARGTAVVQSDGNFTYTPHSGFPGDDSFTYRLCDGDVPAADCDTATVFIRGDSAPDAMDDAETIEEDLPHLLGSVAGNDTRSPDGSVHVWSLVSGVSHGTLTFDANGGYDYAVAANYHGPDGFTYQLCDADNDCDVATVSFTVTPVDDSVDAIDDGPFTAAEDGGAITGSVAGNDSYPDGGSVWTLETGAANGTATVSVNGTFNYTPAVNYSGPDSFTYRLCDGDTPTPDCDTATVSIIVTPTDDGPDAKDDTATLAEDLPHLLGSVAGNDTLSPDGGVHVWSLVSGVSHGTLTFDATGGYDYAVAANYHGTDSFTYKLCEGTACDTATMVFTILSVNDVPVAAPDLFSTPENVALTGTVAGNDVPSGDGGNVWTRAGGPTNGTLSLTADGAFTYTPAPTFNGIDQFNYNITDADGNQSTATVTITVTPGTPGLTLKKTVDKTSAKHGETLTYTLTYHNTGGPASGVTISDKVPTGTTFLSSSGGTKITAHPVVGERTVIWTIGTVPINGTATVILKVKVNATSHFSGDSPRTVTNFGSIRSNETPTPVVSNTVTTNVTRK